MLSICKTAISRFIRACMITKYFLLANFCSSLHFLKIYAILNAINVEWTGGKSKKSINIRPGNRATLGLLRTYFYYCRIIGLIPVIPYPPKITGSSSTIYYYDKNRCAKGPKILICTAYYIYLT
jgi:hypothetical protein